MTRLSPARRSGVTLTEVLIAMFIMAVGMIALLTLFPLGAMQVGQALRDDRCAQAALQADGYMRTYWRHQIAEPIAAGGQPAEPFYWAMDDPNLWVDPPYNPDRTTWVGTADEQYRERSPVFFAGSTTPRKAFLDGGTTFRMAFLPKGAQLPTTNQAPVMTPGSPISPTMLTGFSETGTPFAYIYTSSPTATPPIALDPTTVSPKSATYTSANQPDTLTPRRSSYPPSYPVLVDPIGYQARGSVTDTEQVWLAQKAAGNGQLLVPRRQLNPVTREQGLPGLGRALQVAGMIDDITFMPNGAPGGTLDRQGRYTWAALIQRPDNRVRDVANLTVLVFDGRPVLPAPGDEYLISFTPPPASGSSEVAPAGSRQLSISVINRSIDEPVLLRRGGWIMDATPGQPAAFYRVAGFVEDGADPNNDPLFVPINTKPRTKYIVDLETPLANAVFKPTSRLYLLAGLAEVFVRPQLKSDTNR